MGKTRISVVQIASKLGRLEDNTEKHIEIIRRLRGENSQVIVFPELSLTGYQLKDLNADVSQSREEILQRFSGLGDGPPVEAVFGWLERSRGGHYYNSLAHLSIDSSGSASFLHNHHKINLPTYGMFEEERYFSPGKTVRAYDSPVLGRAGLLLCEDMWHPVNPLLLSLDGPGLEGVRVLMVGSNSPTRGVLGAETEPWNVAVWKTLARHAAITSNCLVVVAQRVGVEDGFVFSGGSEILGPGGEVLARAPLFEEAFLSCDVDLDGMFQERRTVMPRGAMVDYDRLVRELGRIGGKHLDGDNE